MSMMSEIHEQPEAVARLLNANHRSLQAVRQMMPGVTHAIIAARGTSDNAARYAQYVWGARNGLPVALAAPSLFGRYESPPKLDGSLVVGISQSGESPDLVEVMAAAARAGRPTVTMTNHVDSPMADVADVVVDLSAGQERAVAATKTYTAELVAVAALSEALAEGSTAQLAGVPELLRRSVSGVVGMDSAVAGLVDATRCVVVGRGFHHATAFEWALKLQELSYVLAQPYSAADFLHGPVAVVEEGLNVLMVATTGVMYSEMASLAEEVTARGARVVAMSDRADFPGHVVVPVPESPEWLSPIAAAPVLQLFALELTLARGLDPDDPRGLQKVTRTI